MGRARWIRIRWSGDLPAPGHFLKAARERKAFEICEIVPRPDQAYPYSFRILPGPLPEVPEHALIHPFACGTS